MINAKAKQRIAHELKECLSVFFHLAPFFLSFAMYRMYLLGGSENAHYEYGAALVSALVMSKIVLLGELAGFGSRFEKGPLVISTIHKAAVFTLFYLAVDALERTVRELLHGQTLTGALDYVMRTEKGNFVSLALLIFFAFIPFFALRETRRVLGPKRFRDLFWGAGQRPSSGVSGERAA